MLSNVDVSFQKKSNVDLVQ
uniref:Uncharacterized protein n=1 Tax=Arundo donax TaxID=35708 RepID=A0A0A9B4U5_ARUDO